jgi:hypothetical protein
METERLRLHVEDRYTQDVGGQEVARKLNACVLQSEGRGQRLRERRLANTRNVLDQQMTAGEQTRQRKFQRSRLADHDAVEMRQDCGQALRHRQVGLTERADGHWLGLVLEMSHRAVCAHNATRRDGSRPTL